MFYNFLWNGKGDKIKKKVMINDYSEGGLKMIDIVSFNRSLKATWIKRYLDKENCGSWKSFFDLELEKYGGEVTLTGNLDIKESRNVIKISDPFFKEILEIWSEGIISSIKLQRYIPHNTRMWTKHESFLSNFLKSKKSSKLVYKKLVSGKSESPSQSQQKWQEDFFTTKQDFIELERGLSNGFSMYKEH